MTDTKLAALVRLYADQPLAVDRLPYSRELKTIVRKFRHQTHEEIEEAQIYYILLNLRKRRLLPKKGRPQKEGKI